MSSRAQELVARYPARSLRLQSPGTADEEARGPGGLQAAVDRQGIGPLAALLADGETVLLDDEGVRLEVRREGHEAVLRVSWERGPSFEERVPAPQSQVAPVAVVPVAAPPATAPSAAPAMPSGRPVGDVAAALQDVDTPLWITDQGVFRDGPGPGRPLGMVPARPLSSLGAPSFRRTHGVQQAYIAGAMAGGIASVELVTAMSRAGMLGFYGSGGLPLDVVAQAVDRVRAELGDAPAGFNLLHNPVEPAVEEQTVDLYLKGGIRTVSASAYMRLTPAVVRFRLAGIRREGDRVYAPHKVLAKVSRPEVAEQFMRPAPAAILQELVARGALSEAEARMAEGLPVAEDVTVEADSGGHTDRRPLVAMLPVIRRLRDRVVAEEGYGARGIALRVGAAGGLGDPLSVHGALSMGADYVLTGSVNQASLEAGTSEVAKLMLLQAGIADCTTGPAPDMFELGAHVQVLGRGSMYAQRAGRLYELYRAHESLGDIPEAERARLEKQVFRRPLAEVWEDTRAYWKQRDPSEVARAAKDPKHQMALTFRWYLGMTSRWARVGDEDRKRDFQIWCGPAMGLFNDWVAGSWLEPLQARSVVSIARALLHGAAVLDRVDALRTAGLPVPVAVDPPRPWRG